VTALIILLVIIALLVVLGIILVGLYNGLVGSRLRVREAWSGIDVQLKRRSSLIPNLVETVRGYAAHERETLENVTRARAMLDNAGTAQQAAQANNMLTQALRSLFAVSEAYPDLKANQNFLELQRDLTDTEDKIAYARQFYNRNVIDYNTKVATVPNAFVANMFNFQPEEFFEAEEEAREDVRVSFPSTSAPAAGPTAPPPTTQPGQGQPSQPEPPPAQNPPPTPNP
jgi:LemA protein